MYPDRFTQLLPVALALFVAAGGARADYTVSLAAMIETERKAHAVEIADVNGDGLEDLIVILEILPLQFEDSVLIYLQQPDGTLAEPITSDFGGGIALAVGNLDPDYPAEVVVAMNDGVGIIDRDISRGRPVVRETAHPNGWNRNPWSIELIDVDRDGALDIVTKPPGHHIFVHLGDGRGGVRGVKIISLPINNWVDATSGDFNNDGYMDYAVLSSVLRAYVYINNGTEGFAAPYVLNPDPTGVAFYPAIVAGDFNNDGRDDLVIATDVGKLSLYEQGPGGTLSFARDLEGSWATSTMRARDVDMDGLTDIVLSEQRLSLFRQGSNGLEPMRILVNDDAVPRMLAVGDLDGDGCPDIVKPETFTTYVEIWKGHGCQQVADLGIDLAVSPQGITATLSNAGLETALTPETSFSISVLTGSLDVTAAPGCQMEPAGSRKARLTCTSGDLVRGTTQSIVIPLAVHSSDRRNVLSVSATTTTATVENNLRNNSARSLIRPGGR